MEGRLEIFFGDSWGSVCDDDWDLHDANVVCQQLGFEQALEAVVEQPERFGEGTRRLLHNTTLPTTQIVSVPMDT